MAKAKQTKRKTAQKAPGKTGPDANLLSDLMKWAKAAGADAADAVYDVSESIAVAQRMGKREKLESSESSGLRLRAFIGRSEEHTSELQSH